MARRHGGLTTHSHWEATVNGRTLTVLTAITGALAVGEFGSAVIIWLENYPGSFWPAAIVFGGLFLLAAWLLRSGRVTAGAVLAGLLCLFEVVSFAGWTRHNALDWVYQTIFALLSVAGLIAGIAVLAARIRHRAAA
jgi:hypothetical protein